MEKIMVSVVSIIIPCYNGEAVVDRAISSVYRQDYSKVELIVVDDGSTDNSNAVICSWQNRFEEKGWQLKYIYQDNKGLGGAINTGLKYVTGDYLSLLDADDEYLDGACSKRAAYLDSHPECDVVRSNGWVVKGDYRRPFISNEAEKKRDDIFVAFLRGETNNWAGGYMVRTKALFAFYPDREIYTSRYGQNLQLLMPLVYKKVCGFIDEPMMNYILQDNSLSQTANVAEAKERDLRNADGYRDIRVHMLNLIVKDSPEKENLLKNIDSGYWRRIMHIADAYGDIERTKDAYNNLCKAEKPTFDDMMMRYRKTAPAVLLALRVYKKLKGIIGEAL